MHFIPYMKMDGVPNYYDSEIMNLFDVMESEGTVDVVFISAPDMNREKFLKYMTGSGIYLHFIYGYAHDLIGFFWITKVSHKKAHLHFCFFKGGWGGYSVPIAKKILKELFSLKDGNGKRFEMFLGIIPDSNIAAKFFAKRVGGELTGSIPKLIYHGKSGENVSGCYCYYSP